MDIDMIAPGLERNRWTGPTARPRRPGNHFRRRPGMGPAQQTIVLRRYHRQQHLEMDARCGPGDRAQTFGPCQWHEPLTARSAGGCRMEPNARSGAGKVTAASSPSPRATRGRNSTVRTISWCAPMGPFTGPIRQAGWSFPEWWPRMSSGISTYREYSGSLPTAKR